MEALPTLSYFLFGCNGTAFIYLHSTCYISLPKAIHKEFFSTSLNISINKLSLNFLVNSQYSFIYIKVFNYGSFNLNQILLIRSGNVELNPSPKNSSSLPFFHWNLNGIATHNFAKISFIQSYGLSYNIDIIFLTETFLEFSIEVTDPNINISGYNSLRSDHPSNTKRGSVCMFYEDYLPGIRRDDMCALSECIVTEIKLGKISIFSF